MFIFLYLHRLVVVKLSNLMEKKREITEEEEEEEEERERGKKGTKKIA